MMLVWDNGEGYSEHEIHFIDIGGMDPKLAGEIIVGIVGGSILLQANEVAWWEGEPETLNWFICHRQPLNYVVYSWDPDPAQPAYLNVLNVQRLKDVVEKFPIPLLEAVSQRAAKEVDALRKALDQTHQFRGLMGQRITEYEKIVTWLEQLIQSKSQLDEERR